MIEPLLEVRHLTHIYSVGKNIQIPAVQDVSFSLYPGEILGLVGESGCGKSTIARCIMNLCAPQAGEILFQGINTCDKTEFRRHKSLLQTKRQMVFQDSSSSLDPYQKTIQIICEPLSIHHRKPRHSTMRKEAAFQLERVGMEEDILDRYPDELSGGQRQRVAIARALVMEPSLLVADEPIASLDVSVQAQIVNLLKHLREAMGFSMLFIAHDLTMVQFLCDRVGVMCQGKLVELGKTEELFSHPSHPYTQALLSAIPIPDPILERKRLKMDFDQMIFPLDGEMRQISPAHMVLMEKEKP